MSPYETFTIPHSHATSIAKGRRKRYVSGMLSVWKLSAPLCLPFGPKLKTTMQVFFREGQGNSKFPSYDLQSRPGLPEP